MIEKFKKLIKDTFIFALGNVGSKIILFLLVPLYTNYLSTEEYGISEIVYTLSQLIMPFASVVIFDALIRFGLKKTECKENVLLCALFVIFCGSIFTICITPLFSFYKAVAEWKWYLSLYVIVYMTVPVFFNYLKIKEKNKLYAVMSVSQTAITALLNILLIVVIKTGVTGYLLSNIISHIIIAIITFIIGGFAKDLKKAKFKKSLLKQMLVYSSPLILNNVSWMVVHSSDKIMIEAMVSAGALGIYTVATKIPSLINVCITIFSQAWGLSSINEYENSNVEEYYSLTFKFYNIFIFFICIMIVAFTKLFMNFYVSESYSESWKYVPLLLVAAAFSALTAFWGSIYGVLQKSVNNMITTFVAALVNIIVNYFGIIKFGVYGAVIGTLVAYIVTSNLRMFDILRFIKVKINFFKYFASCFVILLQAILVTLDYHIYISSAITLIVFLLIYYKDLSVIVLKISKVIKKRGLENEKD